MPALPPERPGAVPPAPAVQAALPSAPPTTRDVGRAAEPPAAPAPGTQRAVPAVRRCPRPPEQPRPLPDPAGLRLCLIPDSAPPYDDEEPPDAGPDMPRHRGRSPATPWASASGTGTGDASEEPAREEPARDGHDGDGGSAAGGEPGGTSTARQPGRPLPSGQDPALSPAWPSRFAQALAETLAGSRPPRQMVPWTTEHTRHSIQRLGPRLAAGQQPRVLRVVTSRPACDVLEMTVIVGFGPRVRALAVRLERAGPLPATPGRPAQQARWLCTAIEAA